MQQDSVLSDKLSVSQLKVIEFILGGATVQSAAETTGVARETVHRWLKRDPEFVAALNEAKREFIESAQTKLLSTIDVAVGHVSKDTEGGNLQTSISLLKGVGLLDGKLPVVDPCEVSEIQNSIDLQDLISRLWKTHYPGYVRDNFHEKYVYFVPMKSSTDFLGELIYLLKRLKSITLGDVRFNFVNAF